VENYNFFHRNRLNLAIHAVMVPVFAGGVIGIAWCLVTAKWLWVFAFCPFPVLSLALQGLGHQREANSPLPFTGPGNFLRRIFVEQFYSFPLFVLGGGWLRAWRGRIPADIDAGNREKASQENQSGRT